MSHHLYYICTTKYFLFPSTAPPTLLNKLHDCICVYLLSTNEVYKCPLQPRSHHCKNKISLPPPHHKFIINICIFDKRCWNWHVELEPDSCTCYTQSFTPSSFFFCNHTELTQQDLHVVAQTWRVRFLFFFHSCSPLHWPYVRLVYSTPANNMFVTLLDSLYQFTYSRNNCCQ